jgi:ribosomal protein S18 acetylase RimI-like enzyme
MRGTVTFTELGPGEFRPSINRFIAVYKAAMNPPDRMLAGREAILARHAANPGFRALTAVLASGGESWEGAGYGIPPTAATPRGVLAGFTYGFHGVPGQWWHDMVAGALAVSSEGGASGWLADSFEVAELHVLPAYQGAGIGRELLMRLTSGRPEHTAVLSTADTESRARRLYRGVGFTDLLTGFRFSGAEPPYAVMGARLPLGVAAAPAPGSPGAPRSPRPSSW